MPDRLTYLEEDDGYVILPLGFEKELIDRLVSSKTPYKIIRATKFVSADIQPKSSVTLRDRQPEAKQAMLDNKHGLIMASPGFGKTTVGLDAIVTLNQKTLILIDKTELGKQWITRADEQFGIELGLIGDKEWNEKDITVATLQTLRSREKELDEDGFWDRWGVVIYDESHHAGSSDSYFNIVSKFKADRRYGLSATKGKSEEKAKVAEFVFGPVLFEDKSNQLIPTVHRVKTSFDFDYRGTDMINGKRVQNNYQAMMKELIADSDRNNQIAAKINTEPNCAHLVISRRLQHLEDIKNAVISRGFDPERCFMLTGKESSDRRLEVGRMADSGSIVIFSTVADEGLDIPRLDRIHLVFPSKNHETTRQQVGRGLRNHPDKDETIIYDYVDLDVPVMRNQWRNRLNKYYRLNKFPIESYEVQYMPPKITSERAEASRRYYVKNRERILKMNRSRREGINTADRLRRKDTNQLVKEIKENSPCTDCGKTYNWYVMDFDHLDSSTKVMNIARMVSSGYSWEAIETEISKCEIVCSNCHRERTYKRRST